MNTSLFCNENLATRDPPYGQDSRVGASSQAGLFGLDASQGRDAPVQPSMLLDPRSWPLEQSEIPQDLLSQGRELQSPRANATRSKTSVPLGLDFLDFDCVCRHHPGPIDGSRSIVTDP